MLNFLVKNKELAYRLCNRINIELVIERMVDGVVVPHINLEGKKEI